MRNPKQEFSAVNKRRKLSRIFKNRTRERLTRASTGLNRKIQTEQEQQTDEKQRGKKAEHFTTFRRRSKFLRQIRAGERQQTTRNRTQKIGLPVVEYRAEISDRTQNFSRFSYKRSSSGSSISGTGENITSLRWLSRGARSTKRRCLFS